MKFVLCPASQDGSGACLGLSSCGVVIAKADLVDFANAKYYSMTPVGEH